MFSRNESEKLGYLGEGGRDMRPLIKTYVKQYNQNDYDVMRHYLLDQIGSYCSYCEAPISMDSAVEHKVPKSEEKGFSEYQTDWCNLLLACQSCNSSKGATPNKHDVPGGESMGDYEWFKKTMDLWFWPDRTLNQEGKDIMLVHPSYALVELVYQTYSQRQLAQKGWIKPIRNSRSWAKKKYKRVWVIPRESFISQYPKEKADSIRERVKRTIAGLNLNAYNPEDRTFNNRRVHNRTQAFFDAQHALQQFIDLLKGFQSRDSIYLDDGYQPEIKIAIDSIRTAAQSTGFWTVWFSVFRHTLDDPSDPVLQGLSKEDRKNLLIYLFVYYMPGERLQATEPNTFAKACKEKGWNASQTGKALLENDKRLSAGRFAEAMAYAGYHEMDTTNVVNKAYPKVPATERVKALSEAYQCQHIFAGTDASRLLLDQFQ